jgi:hypothetical protein
MGADLHTLELSLNTVFGEPLACGIRKSHAIRCSRSDKNRHLQDYSEPRISFSEMSGQKDSQAL